VAEPQISRKKTTLWNLFYLYVNNIISIVRGILIIPLYLAFIDTELYGAWLATGNILMWLTLFDPGVGDVAIQKLSFSFAKKNIFELRNQVSSSIIISLIISLIACVAGWILSFYLDAIVGISDNIDKANLLIAFNISILSTVVTLFSFSLSGCLIGFQRTKEVGVIRNVTAVIGIFVNVYFLFNDYRLISIALGGFVASLLAVIFYAYILLKVIKKENIGFGFDLKFFKEYNKIFTFTFIGKLFGTFAQNIDLILVSRFIGLHEVTILELTRRPIRIIRGIINSPSIALLPTISNLYGEGDTIKLTTIITKTLKLFLFGLIIICGGIIAFNEQLINLWVGNKFFIGGLLNTVIALTFLTTAFSYVVANMTFSLGKIKTNSIFEIIKNVFSLILLVLLGKCFGLWGIVFASLIASVFSELWFYPLLLDRIIMLNRLKTIQGIKELFITFIFIILVALLISNFLAYNTFITIILFFFYILFSLIIVSLTSNETKLILVKLFKYRKFELY